MKAYIYYFEDEKFTVEAAECKETTKMIVFQKYPHAFCAKQIDKFFVGRIYNRYKNNYVILLEDNIEKAKQIFKEEIEKEIFDLEEKIREKKLELEQISRKE